MSSLTPSGTPVNATPTAHSTFDVKAAAIEVARLLSDDRCSDITVLDVRGMTSVQDFVILASGTSDRQMRSAAADVKNLLPKLGSSVYRTSIDEQGTWIVVDCVDTVIHIFEPNTRAYYDLESMWGDTPKVEWLREGQRPYTPDHDLERADGGDTDEPASSASDSSDPDADLELTTGTAQEFVEQVRASVSLPPPKAAAKPKARAKSAKAASTKPKTGKAGKKTAKKAAASRPVKKVAKKAAAKPARKAASKPAKQAVKKPAAKPALKKAGKEKAVKKKGR
ncbi:MAG TPA: ribosome silencing factor [Phycisphaerales bacterium]|nr:ribosome silencing factor [Phycisphaerales bacterium]